MAIRPGEAFRELIGATDGVPRAVLWRQVATPNYELRSFLRSARRLGLKPVVVTYPEDTMCSRNAFKRALVAPLFIEGVNRLGQPIWRKRQMVNVQSVENVPFGDIWIGNRELPALHHELLQIALPDTEFSVIDGSDWRAKQGGSYDCYLNICASLDDKITLFEDFMTNEAETKFFDAVVRPALLEAAKALGREPAILPICKGCRAASPLWYAYPDSYRAHFEALGVDL